MSLSLVKATFEIYDYNYNKQNRKKHKQKISNTHSVIYSAVLNKELGFSRVFMPWRLSEITGVNNVKLTPQRHD